MLRRYSDEWFSATKRRSGGNLTARYPRRKRALVPVRWYHGTFTLDRRTLRVPTARGCPPLVTRLDRDVPYPAGQVRSVTLGWAEGRLYVDVTAEVPVATYPQGQGPDPARVAGVDLGVIHPYAVAGPDGEGLLVSGRALPAENRQHLRDQKGRRRATARCAPRRGRRGHAAGVSTGAKCGRSKPATCAASGRPSMRRPRSSSPGRSIVGSEPWPWAIRAASWTSSLGECTISGCATGGQGS